MRVLSSREMVKKLKEEVVFRMLGAGVIRSIGRSASFVVGLLKDFWKLLVVLAGQVGELGLAEFGKLAIDGTKVRANVSKRNAMTYLRMKRGQRSLEAEIKDFLRRANEIYAEEDARYGEDRRGMRCPRSYSEGSVG